MVEMKFGIEFLKKHKSIIASALLFTLFCFMFSNFVVDDAYISFRYGKNLVECGELNWNCGEEHVEGYTNFLWTLMFALFYKITTVPIIIMQIIGAIFGLLSLMVFYRMCILIRDYFERGGLFLPLILFSSTYAFAFWSVSGLETSMFLFFILLGIHYFIKDRIRGECNLCFSSLFFGIATLIRPEGVIFFGSGMLFHLIFSFKRIFKDMFVKIFKSCIIYSIFVGPFVIWRIMYYHDIFPNTMHVKKALLSGLPDLFNFLLFFIIFILIEGYFFMQYMKNDKAKIMHYIILLQVIFIISLVNIKPIMSFIFRLYIPIIPLMYIFLVFIEIPKDKRNKLLTMIGIALLIIMPLRYLVIDSMGMQLYTKNIQEVSIPFAEEWQKDKDVNLVAIGDVGSVGYYMDKQVLDLFALNDRYLAKNGFDVDYVLDQNPDIIVLRSYSMNSFEPVAIESHLLYSSKRFQQSYKLSSRVEFDFLGKNMIDQEKGAYLVYKSV